MIVLSLFDGISCGQVALERAGIKVEKYYASEIDKYAIKVTQANYPNTIQLGDIKQVKGENLPKIDLLIGGSPCQGFSFAGKQLNFDDPRSKLFFEYVRLLKECKPTYFLLENVKMKKECQDIISGYLGVQPVKINSNLVSAQNRDRLYWTNLKIKLLNDKNIILNSILENGICDKNKSYCIDACYIRNANPFGFIKKSRGTLVFNSIDSIKRFRSYSRDELLSKEIRNENCFRTLTPIECERLQTLPDNYTNHASDTQRYKMLGNCWTVDVVKHIFESIPKN